MKKKLLAALLCASMTASLLVGCGNDAKEESKETSKVEEKTEEKSEEKSEEAEEPAEPIHLTWGGFTTAGTMVGENSPAELLMEERFNVEIDVASDVNNDNFKMIMSSNSSEMDVFLAHLTLYDWKWLADDGLIRSFPEEWLEEYCPDALAAFYEAFPQAEAFREAGNHLYNGEVWYTPNSNTFFPQHNMLIYRKDWADNLGIAEPTTLEEFHDMLYAFTYDDPDGNGIDDTYGMASTYGWWGPAVCFGAYGLINSNFTGRFTLENSLEEGKMYYTATDERYKQALALYKEWWDEGIINPNIMGMDRGGQRNSWTAGTDGVLYDSFAWCASNQGTNAVDLYPQTVNPDAEVGYLSPLKGDTSIGQVETVYYSNPPFTSDMAQWSLFFGKDATDEQVITVLKMINEITVDQELQFNLEFGPAGDGYSLDENGMYVANPDFIAEKQVEYGAGPQVYLFNVGMKNPTYISAIRTEADEVEIEKSMPLNEGNHWQNPYVPGVVFTNEAFNTYYAEVQKIEGDFFNGVLLDMYDLEADWDEYVEKMNKAGVEKIVAEYQAEYDAQK